MSTAILSLLLLISAAPGAFAQGGDKSHGGDREVRDPSARAWVCRNDSGRVTEVQLEEIQKAQALARWPGAKLIGDGTVEGTLAAAFKRTAKVSAWQSEGLEIAVAEVRERLRLRDHLRTGLDLVKPAGKCQYETLSAWRSDLTTLFARRTLFRKLEAQPAQVAAFYLHEAMRLLSSLRRQNIPESAIQDQVARILYGQPLHQVLPSAEVSAEKVGI